MPPEDQDRVIVVLVRARNPSNIGAAARAIHDLGFRHLRIVNDFPVPFQAARSAVDASSILETAQEFPTVAAAIADCHFILGTTAVGERVLEHPLHPLPQAVPLIAARLAAYPTTRVAILFGSEKTGLSNDELSHCHALLTIPMNQAGPRHLSMNLGQAVAVILYAIANNDRPPHLVQSHRTRWAAPESDAQPDREPQTQPDSPATAGDLERLTTLFAEVLETSGYTRRNPANMREGNLRRRVLRMALDHTEAQVWTGIVRQLQYALRHGGTKTDTPAAASEDQ
jgi:TrmH family RNA methyltransferase